MTDFEHKLALPPGSKLDEYRVVRILGAGGFGVTYLAEHIRAGNRVAIKEYLPNELAVREGATVHPKSSADREGFEWGLARFLEEARTLARFEHRNVVRVQRYFEANNTAYLVMDYEDGASLDALLKEHGKLTEEQLRRVILPIANGLQAVHAAGFLHRDIKPNNVYVRYSDESPVLLDFGAARHALGRHSRSLTGVITAGYSPAEQYESDGNQGPWTDIYALSALCYKAITGQIPVDALDRQREVLRHRRADPLPRLADDPPLGYNPSFVEAVDWGLRLSEPDRPQTLIGWIEALNDTKKRRGEAPVAGPVRSTPLVAPSSTPLRRRWVALGGGALVVTLAGLVYIALETGVVDSSRSPFTSGGNEQPAEESESPVVPPTQPRSVLGGNALLVVETTPAGVEVFVDDEPVGVTPLERSDLRAGMHAVALRHPNYETVVLEDQSFSDGRVLRIERALVRGAGSVTVVTEPRAVWIERDGVRLADGTPVTLDGLPAGTVELTLGADAYRSVRVTAEIPRDGVGSLEWILEPIPYGSLTVEVEPTDAIVTSSDIGPVYEPGMELLEGEYRLTVSRAGYQDVTRTVAVVGDTIERIVLGIDPQPFTVRVTPATARVELVGRSEVYVPGIRLAPGEYRVRASVEEYESVEVLVAHGGEPTVHSIDLVRRPQPFTVVTDPEWARVELLGGGPAYEAGVRLTPGEYRFRVSADGFETIEVAIDHGTEPTSQTVALTLLERCAEGIYGLRLCTTDWIELDNYSGCYLRNIGWMSRPETSSRWSVSSSWSGECSDGLAEGAGTAILRIRYSFFFSSAGLPEFATLPGFANDLDIDRTATFVGSVRGGKANGQWVGIEISKSTEEDGREIEYVAEGPIVDGQPHGHWVSRDSAGSTWEGPNVDGQPHGRWVTRNSDGSGSEISWVDGQMHGRVFIRNSDGSTSEGQAVDGKLHGRFEYRRPNGRLSSTTTFDMGVVVE